MHGLGAVLAQIDEFSREWVISCTSRTLTTREKNYANIEKEALAVVFGTENFRVYHLGNKFELVTDNSALNRPFPLLRHMRQGARCIVVVVVTVKFLSIGGVWSLCVIGN